MTLEELQEINIKLTEENEKLKKDNETLVTENTEVKKSLEKSREINQALINRYAIRIDNDGNSEDKTEGEKQSLEEKIINIYKGV